jgi:hypothetical protein
MAKMIKISEPKNKIWLVGTIIKERTILTMQVF